jgi:iron complex transport system ATP-binding protein
MIAGPNGSGKTTLLRALTGEIAYSGSIRLAGREISTLAPAQLARRRAVLAQENRIAFPFTVGEIVRLGITEPGRSDYRGATRLREALALVGLDGFAGRFYHELSGGERQRVQLARVLCQIWEPVAEGVARWLFLDEPVASLDIRHQLSTMELARAYARRGGGVVAVMHDLNLAAMYGDRIHFMKAGRIIAGGRPETVLRDDLLSEIFGCSLAVGRIPADGIFVLPQSHNS